jgi:sigma-B regulation protein RsbU (phosphoserine phosphatase)
MAVTHALAHSYNGEPIPPSRLLEFVNGQLARRYTSDNGTFVTAFYGIFDPESRTLDYSCAGHNPPRVKRCADGSVLSLDEARGLPLGLFEVGYPYEQARVELVQGDQVIFYTDGITEAVGADGDQYGVDRLDQAIELCQLNADDIIASILADLDRFTGGRPAEDDRTLLVAKVR